MPGKICIGSECKTHVSHSGQMCKQHRDELYNKLDQARWKGLPTHDLERQYRKQLTIKAKISELHKKHHARCPGFDCSIKVRCKGDYCLQCFNKLKSDADAQKQETGKIDKKTKEQLRIQVKSRLRTAATRSKYVCIENGCRTSVHYAGSVCAPHLAALERKCASIKSSGQQIDTLTAKFLAQQLFFRDRAIAARKKSAPTCAYDSCAVKITWKGELCSKHRAQIQKEYDTERAEHGANAPQVQRLRKIVLKQKEVLAKRKAIGKNSRPYTPPPPPPSRLLSRSSYSTRRVSANR